MKHNTFMKGLSDRKLVSKQKLLTGKKNSVIVWQLSQREIWMLAKIAH